MLVRYCSLTMFGHFYVLCSTVFTVATRTRHCASRKLWILWWKWRHIVFRWCTVRRKQKVWKIRNQVCIVLWPRRIRRRFFITGGTGVPMYRVCTRFVCHQLGAFFRCSLCITLSRHHAQLLRWNFPKLSQTPRHELSLQLTNGQWQHVERFWSYLESRHWNS